MSSAMKYHSEKETGTMLRNFSIFILLIILSVPLAAQTDQDCYPPKPNKLVVDAADILSADEEARLEQKLRALDKETSNQVVIVTIKELCAGDAAMTAYEIGRDWGVGQKGLNNGIVILVAPIQKKSFIAPGTGLEGAIPDATAKLIMDKEMIPEFKGENWYAGLDQAVTVLSELARGEYNTQEYNEKVNKGPGFTAVIPFLIFIAIWFLLIFRRTKTYARNNDLGFWAALMLMNAASNRSHRGSWGGFSGGGGGSSFGGGGGFGGFGGGSFGGGGAGGSW